MRLLVLSLVMMLAGCASTNMSAYKDPEFSDTKYSSFVVITNFKSLTDRDFLESRMCDKLSLVGVACKRGLDVFPPTRELSEIKWIKTFRDSGAEALIFIELTGAYSTQTYIPERSITTGTLSSFGDTATYSGKTNTYGGHAISKPVETYKITVMDGKSGKTALLATSETGGNAMANQNTLSISLTSKLIQTLSSNSLLASDAGEPLAP